MKTPDRIAFSIFGFDIMWYGILVALGIAAVVTVVCLRAKRHGLTSDSALNISLVCAIVGILGARLYYVIFNWGWYGKDLTRVFMFREGGLAIHGGLIAGLVAALIICRFKKLRPLTVLDLFFCAIPLGQAIGRWGNFFNGEAHGTQTDLPWSVIIDGVKYHPTFLYESLWCAALFVALIIFDNRRKFEGQTFLLYCIGYSFERFFVEGLRTDSLMLFGTLRQAQVLSALVFALGIAAYIVLRRRSLGGGDGETGEGEDDLVESEDAGGETVQKNLAIKENGGDMAEGEDGGPAEETGEMDVTDVTARENMKIKDGIGGSGGGETAWENITIKDGSGDTGDSAGVGSRGEIESEPRGKIWREMKS